MKVSPLYVAWAGASVAAVALFAGALQSVPRVQGAGPPQPRVVPAPPGGPAVSSPASSLTSVSPPAPSPPEAPQGPQGRIVFDELGVNFGDVSQGTESSHVFVFHNKGEGILKVHDAASTCGCTAAVLGARDIPPGGSSQLKVSFKSGGFSGKVEKKVTVRNSDPLQPAVTLDVRATVHPVFLFNPPALNFGDVTRGEEAVREVTIRDAKDRPFAVEAVTMSHTDLQAEALPVEADGLTHRIRVKLKTAGNPGPLYANMIVRTDRKDIQPAPLVVQALVQGTVRVQPPAIYLGMYREGEKFPPRRIRVGKEEKPGSAPLVIQSVDPGDPGFKASVVAIRPGAEYEIELTVERAPPEGRFDRTMRIVTSEPGLPLTVPVSGVVRGGAQPGKPGK